MPRTTIRSEDVTDAQIKTVDMAVDPTNAANLLSGQVAADRLANVPLGPLEDDIAVLGFQVAAASDLAKYSLRDQIVDTFQDATGVDAALSTNESRDSAGKYYFGGTAIVPTVTGGTITTDGDYTVHKFTTGANYITDTAQDVEYLVVAGGGGGGASPSNSAGGGGAGGYRVGTGFPTTATTYAVVVGSGGAAGSNSVGASGGVSTFSTITSAGGGGGGKQDGPYGVAGGSGGGGAFAPSGSAGGAGNTPSTSPSQGYPGGASLNDGGNAAGGGGGGAGEVGEAGSQANPDPAQAGDGGDGVQNDILITGTPVYYAGGGAGEAYNLGVATGGQGGGGASATAGTANTGGGGGGGSAGGTARSAAAGGSGIVIIRRLTDMTTLGLNLTLVSTATTAEAGTTGTGDVVMLYTPTTGTTTLNTDLKAYVSRDNGTTYTQATLVGKGSYSGTTEIASAHDLDISAQPAGVTMRWKVETLNQSAGVKETRINGMSLGWS